MAKDPAFLFYPGDYLKDTQNLSEKTQVAYDRIMCEHMRNISSDMNNIYVSKKQVKFFTKRLSDDEKEELLFILKELNQGYQIEWVAESIAKRKAYSESRRENRKNKNKKTSKTYDKHMENENENENEEGNEEGNKKKGKQQFKPPTIEEVREYCKYRGNSVNPESFVNHYESKGWYIGKSKMKDWKAAVRTWEQRQNENKQDQIKKMP